MQHVIEIPPIILPLTKIGLRSPLIQPHLESFGSQMTLLQSAVSGGSRNLEGLYSALCQEIYHLNSLTRTSGNEEPSGKFLQLVTKQYGSFENLKAELNKEVMKADEEYKGAGEKTPIPGALYLVLRREATEDSLAIVRLNSDEMLRGDLIPLLTICINAHACGPFDRSKRKRKRKDHGSEGKKGEEDAVGLAIGRPERAIEVYLQEYWKQASFDIAYVCCQISDQKPPNFKEAGRYFQLPPLRIPTRQEKLSSPLWGKHLISHCDNLLRLAKGGLPEQNLKSSSHEINYLNSLARASGNREPSGKFSQLVTEQYGSFENLKAELNNEVMKADEEYEEAGEEIPIPGALYLTLKREERRDSLAIVRLNSDEMLRGDLIPLLTLCINPHTKKSFVDLEAVEKQGINPVLMYLEEYWKNVDLEVPIFICDIADKKRQI